MKEKIYNAINDPNVDFFLFPTPRLKELIAQGEHEYVKDMVDDAKVALLEGKALPVAKDDVLAFVEGRATPKQQWLMATGEIRVAGAIEVIANKAAAKNPQGL